MPNERLRDALLQRGLTPSALAEALSVDPKTCQRWVTQGRPPYPRHRYRICALLGESESYLWPDATDSHRATEADRGELVQLHPSRALVPAALYSRLFESARHEICTLTLAGLYLPEQNPALVPMLRRKAEEGLSVRLLFGDPQGPGVRARGVEERIGDLLKFRVLNTLRYFQVLRSTAVRIRLHVAPLYNSIFRADDQMLVNMHAYGVAGPHAPLMHLRRRTVGGMFDIYAGSFEQLWEESDDWSGEL